MKDQIRIAVLDDDVREIQKTEQMLSAYEEMHPEHKYITACHTQVKTFMEEMCTGADTAGWTYDILLMDIYLPDGNGIKCGRILREKGFEGVIIYISSTEDNFPKALALNAMQYLIKPVSREQLFATLDQAVERVLAEPGSKDALKNKVQAKKDPGDSEIKMRVKKASGDSDTQIQKKRRKSIKELLSAWFHED